MLWLVRDWPQAWRTVATQVLQDQSHRRDADDLLLDLKKIHAHRQKPRLVEFTVVTAAGPVTVSRMEEDVFCGLYSVLLLPDVHRQLSSVVHYSGGTTFVTGASDKLIRVRELDTGKVLLAISGHAGA
jgi:hypothetical protein